MKKIFLWIGSYLLLSLPVFSQEQELSSAEEALTLALENNLGIQAEDLNIRATESLKGSAGALPKTELGTQLGQYNGREFDNAFRISQTIPFPTVFGAKKELITAQTKSSKLQKNTAVNKLTAEVKEHYYQVRYLQEKQKQWQHLDSLYKDFVSLAELKFKAGEIPKANISTAKAKRGEIQMNLKQNATELEQALTDLAFLLNTEDQIVITEKSTFEPLTIETLLDTIQLKKHPEIAEIAQDAEVLALQKRVERAENLPDLSIGYNNQSLIGFETINGRPVHYGAGKRYSFVEVGLTLPITTGSKSKLKSMEFQRQATKTRALQKQKELAAELSKALRQYQQDRAQFDYYQQEALPSAEEIESAALLGYQTGEISYVEYLFAMQTALEIRLSYLENIQEINQTVLQIQSLLQK